MTVFHIQITTTAVATPMPDQMTTRFTTVVSTEAVLTTTDVFVQWGAWNQWSEWAPNCFDDSADSIYYDSSKYYPKRSRTRDCIRTDENGSNTTVAVDDASGNCPYEEKLEKENDANHKTGRFQKLI